MLRARFITAIRAPPDGKAVPQSGFALEWSTAEPAGCSCLERQPGNAGACLVQEAISVYNVVVASFVTVSRVLVPSPPASWVAKVFWQGFG